MKDGALRVGIAGLGTVGMGVVRLLTQQGPLIEARAGRPIEVVAVSARDCNKDRGFSFKGVAWLDDAASMAQASDIDVVVELIGGSDGIAKTLVETCLEQGRSVVTGNKALLAHHGLKLAALGEKSGAVLAYEAAVAAGLPVIKALREGLAGNNIHHVYGMLNGTCNYILCEMESRGADFSDVLAEAQRLGYAEAMPDLDIGGMDTAHKLFILSNLAFGNVGAFEGVYVEGIERISLADIRFAGEFGYRIKLLGVALKEGDKVLQQVHPALVPLDSPLASVDGVLSGVFITGDHAGPLLMVGSGAGAEPTASGVVADLVDIARGNHIHTYGAPVAAMERRQTIGIEKRIGAFYLRLYVADKAGSMAVITQILAEAGVSIEQIVQAKDEVRIEGSEQVYLPVVMITHETDTQTMKHVMEGLGSHRDVAEPPLMLFIEQF